MNDGASAKTRVFGLIGFPVSHSLSPLMQNAAFRAAGVDAVYVTFPVAPGQVETALRGLAAAGVGGVNVTVPHKQEAFEAVDTQTPEAEAAGAVNTVAFRDGRLEGHNTDGLGFLRSAAKLVGDLRSKKVLLLGAGGAARGVATALMGAEAQVFIANRSPEKARLLQGGLGLSGLVAGWNAEALASAAEEVSLVVNASSAGMKGIGEIPLDFERLENKPAVIDLVYAPLETGFLLNARRAGCQVQDGLGMLAGQGEIAFEFWLGVPPPVGVMESAIRDAMT